MKRFARSLVVMLGLVVLGSVLSLAPQKTATGTTGAPVTVVNTPLPAAVTNTAANPVPVSGLVAVGNERTLTGGGFVPVPLEVSVTNGTVPVTGTVSVSGTPAVQDALDSPTAPFQKSFCASIQVSGCPNGVQTTFFVPRDAQGNPQRLVIEYASGSCIGLGTVGLLTTAGGNAVQHSFALVNLASSTSPTTTTMTFGQRTKIYADPDSEVAFLVEGPFACNAAISGYLISPRL